MKYRDQYKEFREDGWPLCPNCGKDELFNRKFWLKGSTDTMDNYINNGLRCYYCSWQSLGDWFSSMGIEKDDD